MAHSLPRRKIHLDFHTHPAVQAVCGAFDPDRFADDLAATGADGVALFAKDHYGYAYYLDATFPVHPNLKADFLPLAAEACRRRGLHTEAYISVCLDNLAYQAHPDWSCRNLAGGEYRWGAPNVLLDIASPLLSEVALPFTREVARTMPVDGVWFDIVMYPDDAFHGEYLSLELGRRGLDDTPEQRGILARALAVDAQRQLREAVHGERPDLGVVFNNQALTGETSAWPYNDVIEVESDPAVWPLYDMPLRGRYARGVSRALAPNCPTPHCGLTTRFQRCWGDFGGLRAPARTQWELGRIFASGTSRVSMGDHLHPAGSFEPAVLRVVQEAFAQCAAIAPLVEEGKPLAEVVILVQGNRNPYASHNRESFYAQLGAARWLTEAHRQYSLADISAPLDSHQVLVLPGGWPLTPQEIAHIKGLVVAGHSLLACGEHALGLEDLVSAAPARQTPLSGQYLRFENDLAHPHFGTTAVAMYSKAWTFVAGEGTETVARCVPPLFDDSLPNNYHPYGPLDLSAAALPAIVAQGNVVLCGFPLPAMLHREPVWAHGFALNQLLKRLSPAPLVELDAAGDTEVAIHRGENRLILHLVTAPGVSALHSGEFTGPRPFALKLRRAQMANLCDATAAPRSIRRHNEPEDADIEWQVTADEVTIRGHVTRPHEVLLLEC